MRNMLSSCGTAMGISLVVLLGIVTVLSGWAVSPVKESLEKQKRFISDASHELKTPLAVICANADVLEKDIGQNKWLEYIKNQTVRMDGLVKDMLFLARADEGIQNGEYKEFDVGEAVLNIALEFESRAYESGKQYCYETESGILRVGNEERIKQAVAILIDNALKRSSGEVRVTAKKDNGKAFIEVYNTGDGIDEKDYDKIFERFYRSEESRDRDSGGYGLGLSIAKSIVDSHKGKISVKSEKGKWASFTIVF